MSKYYTQTTAALKTVTIDTNKIDAQNIFIHPGGEEPKSTRENIIDIIDDVRDIAEYVANTKYLDARGENTTDLDVWGSRITVETNEEGIKVITHNDDWTSLIVSDEILSKNEIVKIEDNKIYFTDTDYINVETEKVTKIQGLNILPLITTSNETFSRLQYVDNSTISFPNQIAFGEENKYDYSLKLPSLKGIFGGFMFSSRFPDQNFGLTFEASNLEYMLGTFFGSKIERFHSSLNSLIIAENAFGESYDLKEFNASLSKMIISDNMFAGCVSLQYFISNLDSLLTAIGMFDNCQLNLESVRNIAYSLPNIKHIENTVYSYIDIYTENEILKTELEILTSDIGQITISWNDLSFPENEEDSHLLSEGDRAIILYELFPMMERKGWTISTNLTQVTIPDAEMDTDYEGEAALETTVMELNTEEDMVEKYYKLINKNLFTSNNSMYIDNEGNKCDIVESCDVIGPKKSSWIRATSIENAMEIFGVRRDTMV